MRFSWMRKTFVAYNAECLDMELELHYSLDVSWLFLYIYTKSRKTLLEFLLDMNSEFISRANGIGCRIPRGSPQFRDMINIVLLEMLLGTKWDF